MSTTQSRSTPGAEGGRCPPARPATAVLLAGLTLLASAATAAAQEGPRFNAAANVTGGVHFTLQLPVEQVRAGLERVDDLAATNWESVAVQRTAPGQTQTVFSAAAAAGSNRGFFRSRVTTNYVPSGLRMRFLYNGYFLTADPRRVMTATNANDRYRLYVLNALLVSPTSGRIVAIWPPFEGDVSNATDVARPASAWPILFADEHPPPPGNDPVAIATWWLAHGIPGSALAGADAVDLQGAVATPGLIDAHFHVSSWAKKVPDDGERFGYLPDVGGPEYIMNTNGVGRRTAREALEAMVQDANTYLTQGTGVVLHGFTYAWLDNDPATGVPRETYLYEHAATGACLPNAVYQLNDVGRSDGGDFEMLPTVLVQSSGQCCWYNDALLKRYTDLQTNQLANRFPAAPLDHYEAPADGGATWTFHLANAPSSEKDLYDFPPPFDVDLRLPAPPGDQRPLVPFTVTEVDAAGQVVRGTAMLPDVADRLAVPPAAGADLIPFYRPIPPAISTQVWDDAAAFAGAAPGESSSPSYGHWDPRRPYESNWYDGAERGLLQYFHDPAGGTWRATGFAEHYVMRDLLTAAVLPPLTVEDNMRMRRNVARWCHRHGLTAGHDIMFYRRRTAAQEFQAYEALSYERSWDEDPAFFTNRTLTAESRTGRFGLRVGLYYYVESMEEVDESLALATDPAWGFDRDRFGPPEGHTDYPGWISWLGWKLQLDGSASSRNMFTSAPSAKPRTNDTVAVLDDQGNTVVFQNHGYGLLTETSEQEQEFTGRETAALYWLVRESDPAPGNPWTNAAIHRDWTGFKAGVTTWIDRSINTNDLAEDLAALSRVDMKGTNADGSVRSVVLADKLSRVVIQVNDAYQRMLTSMAKIWYERSRSDPVTNPIPHQVVCHCSGDGAVDLYLKAIQTLRHDIERFPTNYAALPPYWTNAIPPGTDLRIVNRTFTNERYRVEHLLNVSGYVQALVRNPTNGIEAGSVPAERNVLFSAQPVVMVLEGESSRDVAYPVAQELWPIPGASNFWRDVPPVPRSEHCDPLPLYLDMDIPFTLNTDPPSLRDPRPALTVIGAVARSPVEFNRNDWLDKTGDTPDRYPPDYLVNKVYAPMAYDAVGAQNPMRLTMEQALSAMTFWGAYSGGQEKELGALASPLSAPGGPGWLADFVVWEYNPLAIQGPGHVRLSDIATGYDSLTSTQQIQAVNAFIEKFRPALTVVGGMPMYMAPGSEARWQGRLLGSD